MSELVATSPRTAGPRLPSARPALLVLQMLAVPLAILLVWELSGRLGWIARGILPSPTAVAQGWWQWAVGHDAMGLNAYSGT